MATLKLLERLESGELALGALHLGVGAELIETIGYAGYDYVIIDQMLTPVDWNDTAHMIRAAELAGIASIVRTEANPWVGTADPRIIADVTRALSLGATGVMTSISTRQQMEQMVEVGGDWHRKVHIIPFSVDTFGAYEEAAARSTLIIPLIESKEAVENAEDIISVPGLRAVMIGVTDMAKEVGMTLQYEHPAVWAIVDRIVATCKKHGVRVGANTGYEAKDLESQVQRIKNLRSHGIDFVQTQTVQWMIQLATMTIVRGVGART